MNQQKKHNFGEFFGGVFLGLIIGYLIFGLGWFDIYDPVYYPDETNLTQYIKGPRFKSLDEARAWVSEVAELCGRSNWTYEIGKNYKRTTYGIDIYEDTLR